MDVFSRTALDAHNKLRSAHNVPPLSWSNELARSAQVWAKKMAKEGKLKHDQLQGIGENVFMSSQGFDAAAEEATKNWFTEVDTISSIRVPVRSISAQGGSSQAFAATAASNNPFQYLFTCLCPYGNDTCSQYAKCTSLCVERYDFKKGGHQSGTGHFTQVVWKDSKELGMARAKSANGSAFVVARYYPAGNNLNSFDGNVLPKVSTEDKDLQEKNAFQGDTHFTKTQDSSSSDDSFISMVLQAHNELRCFHNVPHLKWSPALSRDAQAWAEKLSRNGELRHASKEERNFKGENICRMSNDYDVADAVKIWYSEIKSYKYDSPGFSRDTGHFTQIVWRDTTEVGVGTSKSLDGRLTYVVARYNPPGNVLKSFHANVTPRK